MPEPKQLPENLSELLKQPEYAKVDGEFTVKELQSALRDRGIEFKAADNKDALVWRLVDANQETPSLAEPEETKAEIKIDDKKEVEKTGYETLTVLNSGSYNLYEPVSRTVLYAYKETTITFTPSVSKDRVLSNIAQINATRGNVLTIL